MPSPPGGAGPFQGDSPNARFGNGMSGFLSGQDDPFGFRKNGTFGPMFNSAASSLDGKPNGGTLLGGILRQLGFVKPPSNPITGVPLGQPIGPPSNTDPTASPVSATDSTMPPANVGGGINPNAGPPPTVPNANSPSENASPTNINNMAPSNSSGWLSKVFQNLMPPTNGQQSYNMPTPNFNIR